MSVFAAIAKFLFVLTVCEAVSGVRILRWPLIISWTVTLLVSLIFVTHVVFSLMTMKQINSTGKMMRKSCQPKNNVEDAKIDPINEGVFIEEKEIMCYIACIMKMANAIKNGKVNYEAAIKQADLLLPEEIKEHAKAALTACRKVPDSYNNICEAAFYMTKCVHRENPAAFFFP